MIDYYVKNYCRDLTRFTSFENDYNAFVDGLAVSDKNLRISGRAYVNYLSKSMSVLCSYWYNFRYYDIQSRNYKELLRKINLAQYNGLTVSTLSIFRKNLELMSKYDIRDGYELHNLLRKLYRDSNNNIQFERMPLISIGKSQSPK